MARQQGISAGTDDSHEIGGFTCSIPETRCVNEVFPVEHRSSARIISTHGSADK